MKDANRPEDRTDSGSAREPGTSAQAGSGSAREPGMSAQTGAEDPQPEGRGPRKTKKKKWKKTGKVHSISFQLSALFIGMLMIVLTSMLAINNIYMTQFYELRVQRTLKKAYRLVDEHVDTEDGVDTEYFENEFRYMERSGNIALVISDTEFHSVVEVRREEDDVMAARLNAYSMGLDQDDVTIIEKSDEYVIQKKSDTKYHMEFLEMWGTLPSSGYHFMMRIPMDSIRMNAKISNEFIFYSMLLTAVVGIVLIGWLSRRIARPVRELTDLSARMANLDFNAKYTSGGKNEIGQLGEHFNQMSETLEKTISELKTANNELQKNLDEKTKIDDMRREFLSNVSHELKTPLALIQGYAEGLQESVADDPESRDYYCEVIVDEAEKMNTLVKKLLTLNQLEFGEDQVEMVRFDLGELIRGKVASSRILADQKNAQLSYEGPDHMEVWGDEFKVEEVLTNYLSNAINHVDDLDSGHIGSHRPSAAGDGTRQAAARRIIVRAERTKRIQDVDGTQENEGAQGAQGLQGSQGVQGGPVLQDTVRISVFNSGSHIPEEDIDQVWDKFFKVDKARTREYGGSGVGLSIVRAIMESFHQKFGVRNVPDGVEFWFELEYAGSKDGEDPFSAEKSPDESTYQAQRRERKAREAAEKEALKRMRREMREDDVAVDGEWVSAEPPGANDQKKNR